MSDRVVSDSQSNRYRRSGRQRVSKVIIGKAACAAKPTTDYIGVLHLNC